jgi:predicted nuclease of predicted toxin-antitoxin system
MKFLVDECLSPHLVSVANGRGFEAYHVAHRGWGGLTDAELLEHLLAEELVLVTNNRDDFLDLVSGVELHPGLVVILENVRRARQIDLFESGLDALSSMASSINKVVEIDANGKVTVFELPKIG